MGTLVDFLTKKGFEVEASPNAKISAEAFDLVVKEFGKEQIIKEQSKKVAKKQKRKKEKKEKHKKDAKKKNPEKEIPEVMGEAVDDGYDGYYNDVLPPDTDRVKDGLDKELVKKIGYVRARKEHPELVAMNLLSISLICMLN